MSTGRFRCIHCGERFNLDNENDELYNEGHFMFEPDCCNDCDPNPVPDYSDYPEYSDADSGL